MSNWRSVLGLTIGLLVGAGVTVGNAAEIPNWAREQLALRKTVDHWIRADIQAYHDQGFKAMFPDIRGHGADEIGGWTRSWLGAYCLSGNEDIPRTMKALRDTWREGVTNSGHYRRGYPANKESDTVKHTAEGFSQGMLNMLYLDLKDPKSVSFVEEAAGLAEIVEQGGLLGSAVLVGSGAVGLESNERAIFVQGPQPILGLHPHHPALLPQQFLNRRLLHHLGAPLPGVVHQHQIKLRPQNLPGLRDLRGVARVEIKRLRRFAGGGYELNTMFLHETGAAHLLDQTQPLQRLESEGQQRFANVVARKLLFLNHQHPVASLGQQRCGARARRSRANHNYIQWVMVIHG